MKQFILLACLLTGMALSAQDRAHYAISGKVTDETGAVLPGCHVHFRDVCHITDVQGRFSFSKIEAGPVRLRFSFIGFQPVDTVLMVKQDTKLTVVLRPEVQALQAVQVNGRRREQAGALRQEQVSADFVMQNYAGSFAKSIERLVGVNAMDIGATASKPMIRGMGLNRVVVSENGVKQEGQQWGADHGLELDPFHIESAVVVKGASGIEYGSDAIGGFIQVRNDKVPARYSLSGQAALTGKLVNNTVGGSFYLQGRSDHWFYKGRVSALSYGDYRIPTDTIVYLDRQIPIYNRRLKNTAGNELNLSGQVGYLTGRLKTTLSVSDVNQQSGFFPGAHGAPDLERVRDDGDARNIGFPYQNASHIKVISNTRYHIGTGVVKADLAYQDNHRQEWSAFHTHYPNQSPPENKEDLELDFRLQTYNINVKYEWDLDEQHELVAGVQNQWKQNAIDGYNFLLPAYQAYNLGLFIKDECSWNDRLTLFAAVRFDRNQLTTEGFFDPVLYDYFTASGHKEDEVGFYATRSQALDKQWSDWSWMLGLAYHPVESIELRVNMGKAFRTPTAIELAANGIHHGSFRHEVGTPGLSSEKGDYADASLEWNYGRGQLYVGPYIYYFSNYIFLQPTGEWSFLPHAGQIYRYAESEAMLSGVEFSWQHEFSEKWGSQVNFEYIYNQQLTDASSTNYPLPFSPPVNGFTELTYRPNAGIASKNQWQFFINSRMVMRQERIARNEESTPGYALFGGGVSVDLKTTLAPVQIRLQVNNAFDRTYFNHVSFYRKLEMPEPGRNVQLMVKIPFELMNN